MKRIAGIIAGALLFGVVAGASMVGVNIAAQHAGIAYQKSINAVNETAPAGGEQSNTPVETESTPVTTSTPSTIQTAPVSSSFTSVTEVAKNAMPSVVAITNMVKYRQNGYSIFGNYQSYETEVPASGSGVIVQKTDTELLILTNNHVVESSESLSVTFIDDESVDAVVKGTDAAADLALIAIKLENIPTKTMEAISVATLGDSDQLEVGDQVVAIGNALGYGQSVTTGIISAKDRDVATSKGTSSGLLQTDAAINPGNSGGALINMKGEVIGINVAKYTSTSIEGMGYSIPSSKAKKIVDSLSSLETREEIPESERGYLGIMVKNIDAQTAESFGMPQGVFIYKFIEGSTAQNEGLQEKDIITAMNGQGVTNFTDLSSILAKYRVGETVTLTIQRPNGDKYDELNVNVVLGQSPSSNNASSDGQKESIDPFARNNGESGNDGSSQNSENYSMDSDEFWRTFEEFFNEYQ
ncbi:S1C family serine protease [Oribacterium sp. FC2011]|uniref:S1C family serine protease n=1 Tax=Oribacterium sp. FC2011 TaxID=1408311 RepID=UPI0005D1EF92|nr:trypsin-like peptidase domain-containing protein [Oribacterium sp. FC2011]